MVDLLHTMYLGPMQQFVKHVLWVLLLSASFNTAGDTAEEKTRIGVLKLRAELMSWYHQKSRLGWVLSKMSNLTVKMLGSASAPKLKAKAMETHGLLLFSIDMLSKYGPGIGAECTKLIEPARLLARYCTVVRTGPPNLSNESLQDGRPQRTCC